jgi:hypothetical protein
VLGFTPTLGQVRVATIWKSIKTPTPKWSPLGSVWVHSLTFSYTPENMKCDFQASFMALTFVSPCLGCKPKVKVAIIRLRNKAIILVAKHYVALE